MKKIFAISLLCCLIFLCSCTPRWKKNYSFYQGTDQIVSIEILQTDNRYSGFHIPVKVVSSLPQESFAPIVTELSTIDGAYSPYGGSYLDSYVIMVHYKDGAAELLYSSGSVYKSADGEMSYNTYYFGTKAFKIIIKRYSGILIALPG